jgi:deoxyxylulose-5-phosphate synthase
MSQPVTATPAAAPNGGYTLQKPEMKRTREGFGHGLVDLGEKRSDVFVLVGDLSGSTNVTFFAQKFPDRFIQVGIAEQNMMCIAAGLAAVGRFPTWRPTERSRRAGARTRCASRSRTRIYR